MGCEGAGEETGALGESEHLGRALRRRYQQARLREDEAGTED